MARETGFTVDRAKKLIERLETIHNVIRYDEATKEVLIFNWGKYNWSNSGDLKRGVVKVAAFIKSDAFRDYVEKVLDGGTVPRPSTDPLQTLHTPSLDPRGTSVSVSVSESVSGSVSESDYTEDFEIFWNEYPRKVGKKDAFNAFKKAKQPVQVLINAVREQKQSEMWTKENGRYIPNPATWLNQGRWDDVLQKPKAGAKNNNGFYTLSNGIETSNQFLAMLDKEVNGDKERNDPDVIHVESSVS